MAMLNPYNYKKPAGIKINNMMNSKRDDETNNTSSRKNDAYANNLSGYLEQKVNAAKPEELTLMLYDGIIKFINQSKIFNDQKNIEKSSNSNMKAQAIIDELRATLDMDIEMSARLEDLYLFMNERLVDANVSKDNQSLDEVLELITDLRDTWKTAMKL